MARVTKVVKARKAQGNCRRCGKKIKKGDSYYHFSNRIGRSSLRRVYCNEHPPKPSEKTTSDKLSQLYAAQEAFEDGKYKTLEEMAAALREAAEVAETVKDEYQESLDNMPDALRDSDPNDIQSKIDSCETWKDELESKADEIETLTAEQILEFAIGRIKDDAGDVVSNLEL